MAPGRSVLHNPCVLITRCRAQVRAEGSEVEARPRQAVPVRPPLLAVAHEDLRGARQSRSLPRASSGLGSSISGVNPQNLVCSSEVPRNPAAKRVRRTRKPRLSSVVPVASASPACPACPARRALQLPRPQVQQCDVPGDYSTPEYATRRLRHPCIDQNKTKTP